MFVRKIAKNLIRIVADPLLVPLLAMFCASKTSRASSIVANKNSVHLLALSPKRFNADLRALEATGEFIVHAFPEYWQYFGLALYDTKDGRQRRFLETFLKAYRRYIPFDIVVGTSVWYKQDIPWGSAAQRSGTPYIILHKECFKPEPPQARAAVKKALKLGPFMGERLLLHNKPMAEAFINQNYVVPARVDVCGAMRMDKFVKQAQSVDASRALQRKRPLVTYFSFALGLGLDDRGVDPFPITPHVGWNDLFRESHLAFAKLALRRPDIDFVIKTKWGGQWTELIADVLEDDGIGLDAVNNLSIQSAGSAHDLIFDSVVVCSFSSTTILEAGVAGKPVVIPHFGEVEKEGFCGRVKLLDQYHLFDIGYSPGEFTSLIEERLCKHQISSSVHEEIRELFQRWVSPLDGSSLARYVEVLKNAAKKGLSTM